MSDALDDREPELGTEVGKEDPPRRLRRAHVIGGRGSWAYLTAGIPPLSSYDVIADTIYDPRNVYFLGMIDEFYTGPPHDVWVMIQGYPEPEREKRIYVEDEDEGLPRFERR